MKRIYLSLAACLWAAAASASETLEALVDASPEQLQAMQDQANEDLAALRSLLKHNPAVKKVQAAEETGAPAEVARAKPPARSNAKRVDEDSFATVLPVSETARTHRAFKVLQAQVADSVQPQLVLERIQEFVNEHPNHRDARLMLARQQMLAHNLDAVVAAAAPLLAPIYRQSHPDWQPWFWAGSAHLGMGHTDLARDLLEVALSKDSSKVQIWVQLAVLEQETANHAGALQYLDIAAQLDPNDGDIYLNRAYSLEHLGKFAEAKRAYQRFLVAGSASAGNIKPTVLRRITTLAQHTGR